MLALMLAAATATTAQTVPTQYEAGHFYATPQTTESNSVMPTIRRSSCALSR